MYLEGGSGLGRRDRARRDRDQVVDDLVERSAGIQLMGATLPEERLNPGEVIQDHRPLHWCLSVHTLFDRGYVTVTPDRRFHVSRRLRDDFHNGEYYVSFDGR